MQINDTHSFITSQFPTSPDLTSKKVEPSTSEKLDKGPVRSLATKISSFSSSKLLELRKQFSTSNVKKRDNSLPNLVKSSQSSASLSKFIEDNIENIFIVTNNGMNDTGRKLKKQVSLLREELTEITKSITTGAIDESVVMMDKLRQAKVQGFSYLNEVEKEVNNFFEGAPNKKEEYKELEKELLQVIGKIIFNNNITRLNLQKRREEILAELNQFGPLQEEVTVMVKREVPNETDPSKTVVEEVLKKSMIFSKAPLNENLKKFADENADFIKKKIEADYLMFQLGETKLNPKELTHEQQVRKVLLSMNDNKIAEEVSTKLSILDVFSERNVIRDLSDRGKKQLLHLYEQVLRTAFKEGQKIFEELQTNPRDEELIKKLKKQSGLLVKVQRNMNREKKAYWTERTRSDMLNWTAIIDKSHKYSNKPL